MIPLHRGTGACAVVASLLGRHTIHVAHSDLIAVVDERAAWHGQQKGESNLHVFLIEQVMHTLHIVIARRDAAQTLAVCTVVVFQISFDELTDITVAFFGEVRCLAEKIHVVGRTIVQQEIHVEAGFQRFLRIAPLGDEGRFRIFFIKEGTNLLPQQFGVVMIRICFYEAGSHINAETITAKIKPEGHDILQDQAAFLCLLGFGGKLPWSLTVPNP